MLPRVPQMGAAVLRSPALSWPGVAARTGRTRLCLVFRVPGSELQHHCRYAFPLDWSGAVVPGGGWPSCLTATTCPATFLALLTTLGNDIHWTEVLTHSCQLTIRD